ncbi:MAG: hypothetical protein H3C31_05830 [Brumimicrobium sp.]|nr:hypothetical protein [Brumimicrobium sp.]MCO5267376.1 hypothetical protein [Brumimicrobium sp.]
MKTTLTLFLLFSLISFAPSKLCPICHSSLSKTIQSKTKDDVRYYLYTCKNDHDVWLKSDSSPLFKESKSSTSNDCSCPVCGKHGYVTGIIGVKKCIKGHTFKC